MKKGDWSGGHGQKTVERGLLYTAFIHLFERS
jgi:hypothetical protein